MATSGTFTGSRGGSGTGPWLSLEWDRVEEDIANNRSRLYLTLRLHSDYNLQFSASKSGNLEGTSFTYSSGFSGTGSKVLKTKYMWVNHNSDGTKSITLNASFNIAVTWGGNYVSSLSVSGTANITAIPRASDLTSFDFDNPYLSQTSQRTAEYTIDRKYSGFSHDFTLKFKGVTIQTWSDGGNGARTQAIWSSNIDQIIQLMPNESEGHLTLEMQTKDGSTNIGNTVSKTEWIALGGSISPSAGSVSKWIYGTGRDDAINKYVQNISKVSASFSASPGFGASIASQNITVKRQSDGANSQLISGNSGTTPNPVSLSGTYVVEAYVKDTRGREDTSTTTISVSAYSPPRINTFATSRNGSTTSTVNAAVDVDWSLAANNPTDVLIKGDNGSGSVQTLYSLNNSTAGSIDTIQSYTGQSDASSFQYTITVTDSFGKVASAIATVGTTFVELTIAKGSGIGVGKVHEDGALDVEGATNLKGNNYLKDHTGFGNKLRFGWHNGRFLMAPYHASNDTWRWDKEISYNFDNTRWELEGKPYFNDGFTMDNYRMDNGHPLLTMRDATSGSNDLMLIQDIDVTVNTGGNEQAYVDFTFPVSFVNYAEFVIAQTRDGNSVAYNTGVYNITNTGGRVYIRHLTDYNTTLNITVTIIAAGRRS